MSKDLKPNVYYLIRRGWYSQVIQLCEQSLSKKGKEPIALYWQAFALGMSGQIHEAIRILENFQSRRDLQLPMSLALIYFHQRAANVDREAVQTLKSELAIAETVTVRLAVDIPKINFYFLLYFRKKLVLYWQLDSNYSLENTTKQSSLPIAY